MTSIEEIYERYYKDVYLFVLSQARNEHVAEEIAQETFMKAMKSINRFEGKCDIRVWLCQIAKNTFYSYAKKTKNKISIDEEHSEEVVSDVNIEASFEDQETAMMIHKILHTLEEPYKEVFYMRLFGELSFSKIAAIYGKTESWARVTYHRAKLMIREKMEEML